MKKRKRENKLKSQLICEKDSFYKSKICIFLIYLVVAGSIFLFLQELNLSFP